jgi:hypothetical protein
MYYKIWFRYQNDSLINKCFLLLTLQELFGGSKKNFTSNFFSFFLGCGKMQLYKEDPSYIDKLNCWAQKTLKKSILRLRLTGQRAIFVHTNRVSCN